jgi:cytoskeletal protein CcmA (bactofilin family)
MGKISTYSVDTSISGGDKLLGTDVSNNNATKNFTVSDLVDYISEEIPAKTLAEVTDAGNITSGDIVVQGEMESDSILNNGAMVTQTAQVNGACSVASLSSSGAVSGTTGSFTGLLSTTGGLRFTGNLNIGGGNSSFTSTSSVVEQDGLEFNGRTEIKTELINVINIPQFNSSEEADSGGLVAGDIYYNTAFGGISVVLP